MIDTFRRRHGLRPGALLSAELAASDQLILDKFGTEAWRAKVP